MTKIPNIRKIQQITENSHLQMIEVEREMLCKEIEKAARNGDYNLYIGINLANENIELLKDEGYHLKHNNDEWGAGFTISWHPYKVKKRIFNF